MLKDITIQSLATEAAYARGCRDYLEGRVRNLYKESSAWPSYTASVSNDEQADSRPRVRLSSNGESVEVYSCDCPSAAVHLEACHHVVALLKELQEDQRKKSAEKKPSPMSSLQALRRGDFSAGDRMLRIFEAATAEEGAPQFLTLEPHLYLQDLYYRRFCWLEFRIAEKRPYVMRNLREFLSHAEDGRPMKFGKELTVDTARMQFSDEVSNGLWKLMLEAWRDETGAAFQRNSGFYGAGAAGSFNQKQFFLTHGRLRNFFQIMGDREIPFQYEGYGEELVKTVQANPRLQIRVEEAPDGSGCIQLLNKDLRPLDNDCLMIYEKGKIYLAEESFAREARLLLSAFPKDRLVHMDKAHMSKFFGELLPRLQRSADVEISEDFRSKFLLEPLQAQFYVDYYGNGLEVRPEFHYGEVSFNPATQKNPKPPDGRILVRDKPLENELLGLLAAYGFQKDRRRMVQPDEERSYDFLTDALPKLSAKAEVFYADAFEKKPVRAMPKITAGVSVNDMNLLEVTFSAKDIDFDELMDILADYRQKRRYHRMTDGTFVTLEEQQLSAMADFVENTGLKKGMADEERKVQLSLSHAMYLDELAREDESIRLERSKRFRAIVRDIRHPGDADVDVPDSLKNTLRDYQVTGFRWLSSLASCGLGGILADDMGLGKTLQVIAFLLAHREEGKPPSLVVAPTSLMYNWMDEIQRFAPELKAAVVAGNKGERETALEELDTGLDVIITTYNMLKRDIDLYGKKEFRYCFLDEAQHIKNPVTQNARSVKKIKTGGYFALTGTPIENTLTELWSIFDFLMPGYLGNHAKFKQRYEIPIVRAQDAHALKDLKQHVMPFILRRMKKDVLQELPDKVESRRTNEMTPKQAKIYQAYFLKSQKEFAMAMQEAGFAESRIKILAILTRLRQIACDPSLFLEDYDGGSGKLDMLEEVVEEAAAGGHRMLVFSQFTTMLKNIAKMLDGIRVPYFYLDGSTPAVDRMRLVKEFNGGKIPVFLISLKAGGTGLNLTGADMVIHYDPWWNPAVEDQATDRAYRIGQQRNVQVLKFITKDTIEEKIYKLQEKKKSLVDQMIQPGENFLSKLTEDEIRELFRGD